MYIGTSVLRNQPALRPIIGTIKALHPVNAPYRAKPQATVVWQHTAGPTTSTVAIAKLIEATPENVATLQAKAKRVTPAMKSALLHWQQCIPEGDTVRFDDIRVRLGMDWDAWWRSEKAFKALIALGYFDGDEGNTWKNTGNRMYRMAKKEE